MKTAYICLVLTGLMPIMCTAIAKWGFENFDNHNPRQWLSEQTGFRARANAAQANCFEAFPFFATSVLCAIVAKSDLDQLSLVCMLFVALRLLYVVFYITDKASLRTGAWISGFACILINFFSAIY